MSLRPRQPRARRLARGVELRDPAYAPLEDFDPTLLERTPTTSHCPFKGDASCWSRRVGTELREDAVWGYEEPSDEAAWLLPEAMKIAGLVCFSGEGVQVDVDA